MKNIFYLLILFVLFSCENESLSHSDIIKNNPSLIGHWAGVGGFLDKNTSKKLGDVELNFTISENQIRGGSIGDASIKEMSLSQAKYGYDIKGILESKIKEGVDFEKDHLIILLVLPKGQDSAVSDINANFHLKSNFIFDFGMRVGGVYLTKTEK